MGGLPGETGSAGIMSDCICALFLHCYCPLSNRWAPAPGTLFPKAVREGEGRNHRKEGALWDVPWTDWVSYMGEWAEGLCKRKGVCGGSNSCLEPEPAS